MRKTQFFLLLVVSLLCALPVFSGEVILDWEPSQSATGYKIYRGDSAGDYTSNQDVNNTTIFTVDGLADCTMFYFATTAYNQAGESGYSNEISTWARPIVAAIDPPAATQGSQMTVSIIGTNFRPGSVVNFSDPGIVLQSVDIVSCGEIRATIAVNGNAPSGNVDVTVIHPNDVAATVSGLFAIGGPPAAPGGLVAL